MHNHRRTIILLLFAAMLYGCVSQNDVAGCYVSNHDYMILNEDGTFWYAVDSSAQSSYCNIEGRYEIVNHSRRIAFFPKESYFTVESCDTCNAFTIKVYDDKDMMPLGFADIQLFKEGRIVWGMVVDSIGVATITDMHYDYDYDSIAVKYVTYNDFTINYTKKDLLQPILVTVYLTENYDWRLLDWKWRIVSKTKIKSTKFWHGYMMRSVYRKKLCS